MKSTVDHFASSVIFVIHLAIAQVLHTYLGISFDRVLLCAALYNLIYWRVLTMKGNPYG